VEAAYPEYVSRVRLYGRLLLGAEVFSAGSPRLRLDLLFSANGGSAGRTRQDVPHRILIPVQADQTAHEPTDESAHDPEDGRDDKATRIAPRHEDLATMPTTRPNNIHPIMCP
jgi:hypothetical protein